MVLNADHASVRASGTSTSTKLASLQAAHSELTAAAKASEARVGELEKQVKAAATKLLASEASAAATLAASMQQAEQRRVAAVAAAEAKVRALSAALEKLKAEGERAGKASAKESEVAQQRWEESEMLTVQNKKMKALIKVRP